MMTSLLWQRSKAGEGGKWSKRITLSMVGLFYYFISRLIKDKETSRTLSKFIECAGNFTLQNWLTVCIRQLSSIKYRVTLLSKCLQTVAINHHLYRISSNSQKGQCFILFLHHTVYIKHKQRHNTVHTTHNSETLLLQPS